MSSPASQNLSIAHGDTLRLAESSVPATLVAVIESAAERPSSRGITFLSASGTEEFISYEQLFTEARSVAAGLSQSGFRAGSNLIFQFDRPRDFLLAFWACTIAGVIPIPLSVPPVYENSNHLAMVLLAACAQFENAAVITSSQLERLLVPFAQKEVSSSVRVVALDDLAMEDAEPPAHRGDPDDVALLSLTSGTTGDPKIVALTHANIVANIIGSSQMTGVNETDISLNWLRLEHVAVLIRCSLRDAYVGNRQIQAPLESFQADPLVLLDWIERFRVSFAALPNFALAMINERFADVAEGKWDLSSIKSIISVAEPIVPRTAQSFLGNLCQFGVSDQQIHSGWGMSETGGTVTFCASYLGQLQKGAAHVEVGRPMPGLSVRVVDTDLTPVDEGETGSVQVRGAMVAAGYYCNKSPDSESFTPDGWLRTGDLGQLKSGKLTITGRESDIIIINGNNRSCRELEATVEEISLITPSLVVACAVRVPESETDAFVLFFHSGESEDPRQHGLPDQIRKYLLRQTGTEPASVIRLDRGDFPRNARGKLDRKELRLRFERGDYENGTRANHSIEEIDHVGKTAFNVAQWRVDETEKADPWFYDHIANIFLDQERVDTAEMVEEMSPATKYLVTYRAKVFDDTLLEQIDAGIRQVVILGAGLDSRAIRFGVDRVKFFEIDKEETCSFKSERLRRNGYWINSEFVPCDYTALNFVDSLVEKGFDCDLPTYFVWEGNTMYLSEEDIASVLRGLRDRVVSFCVSFDYLTKEFLDLSQTGQVAPESTSTFQRLDAPWVTGFDDVSPLAEKAGYSVVSNHLLIDHLLQNHPDSQLDSSLFGDYYVCTLAPSRDTVVSASLSAATR